ncbi:MAG: phenylalanine--tRNA ligase subunit beta [Bacteroidetes bacterium]|nr:phenylalanine--tRNA ligase subunit beta [Bacteroidota bacterium]
MKFSLNWVKELIPGFEYNSIKELNEKMIAAGLDIESIEFEGEKFKNFVVGKVVEKTKHPDADKLSVCKVDAGTGNLLSIVCGAPNVDAGQLVCVAKVGAIVPNGEFEIKKAKLRGVLSEGMICSAKELNLSEDHNGIMVLDEKAKIGQDFAEYIGADDYVYEIGVTPNRGDLLSHIGVAREIAAAYGYKCELPEVSLKEEEENAHNYVEVQIDNSDYCKRFRARIIKDVEVKESPEWLKKKLTAIGLRPRNNIVDITNYVMMETGQPMHAFDYDKILGKKIIVKTANEGDKFTTLDSKERVLNDKSLMICDAERYLSIAGIMGGENSEITETTKNVLLETAYFDSVAIRLNAKKLGLASDASHRFERGTDVEMVEYASDRACELISELGGGKILKGCVDNYPQAFSNVEIELKINKVNSFLGLSVSKEDIISLLAKIEIEYLRDNGDNLVFKVPEFRRNDISSEIDLIEDIARIYGYDNIPQDSTFRFSISESNYNQGYLDFQQKVKNYFYGRGFNEILTSSQQEDDKLKIFNINPVKIANPGSSEMNSMRVNLYYGMLNVIKNNQNHLGKDISLKMYETGKVFFDEGKYFREEDRLCIGICGNYDLTSFDGKERDFDLFDLKGEVNMFLQSLNIQMKNSTSFTSPEGIKIKYETRDNYAGELFKVESKTLKLLNVEIEKPVYIAEFNLQTLYKAVKTGNVYEPISKFPPVKRDLSFVVEKNVVFKDIKDIISKSGGKLLTGLHLFDLYEDKKLGNNKSLAFSLEFSSFEKTLTDEEINPIISKIVKNLEKELKAQLRA